MNLTVAQAAARLGVERSQVYHLIRDGKLAAVKWGRDWMIDERDLKRYKPKPAGYPKGRPRKTPV